jgi:hypothetical protein
MPRHFSPVIRRFTVAIALKRDPAALGPAHALSVSRALTQFSQVRIGFRLSVRCRQLERKRASSAGLEESVSDRELQCAVGHSRGE